MTGGEVTAAQQFRDHSDCLWRVDRSQQSVEKKKNDCMEPCSCCKRVKSCRGSENISLMEPESKKSTEWSRSVFSNRRSMTLMDEGGAGDQWVGVWCVFVSCQNGKTTTGQRWGPVAGKGKTCVPVLHTSVHSSLNFYAQNIVIIVNTVNGIIHVFNRNN